MKPDNKPSSGLLVAALEGWRDFYRWRLSLKSTTKGKVMIFAAQFVIGVFMAQLIRAAAGAPNNLIAYLLTLGMGVGVGIAGPLSFFLSSIVFWLVVGTVSGLAVGVWPYLPSWWREAHSQWMSGATIPSYVVGGGVVLVVAWVLSSIGIAKVRDNAMPRLLGHLILQMKDGRDVPQEDDVRRQAMPTDAEAERMIRSAFDEESGSVIRPMPRRVEVVLDKKEDPPITSESLTDSFLLETAAGTEDLAGLATGDVIAAGANLSKAGSSFSASVPVAASNGEVEPVAPPPAAVRSQEASGSAASSVDGQGQFRLKALLGGYELAMNEPDQFDSIDRFVREFSALIEKLSLSDLDFIKTQQSGEGLHSLIVGITKGRAVVTASNERGPESMFGTIADPVTEAIEAATPVPVIAPVLQEARQDQQDSVPNPDAEAEVPEASGKKASSSSIARMLTNRTAKALPASPSARKQEQPAVEAASPEDALADDKKSSTAALRSKFGITPPNVLGEQRDDMLKAALAGLPIEGVEGDEDADLAAASADMNVGSDGDAASTSGHRFGSGAGVEPEPIPDHGADTVAAEDPLDSDLGGVGAESVSLDGLVAEEQLATSVDDVPAAATPPLEEAVEVIGSDGMLHYVLARDVASVTAPVKVPSPLDELPDNPTDDDFYELGLIPYDRTLGTDDADLAKDVK